MGNTAAILPAIGVRAQVAKVKAAGYHAIWEEESGNSAVMEGIAWVGVLVGGGGGEGEGVWLW